MKRTLKRSESAKLINEKKLTPEEMYSLIKRENIYGIEGYNVPRQYYDYNEIQWEKKRKNILNSFKRIWPPDDWPKDKNDEKKKIPPINKNYIYNLEKWLNSYYDPKRAEELIEKGINIKEYIPKQFIDKDKRKKFLENEKTKSEFFKNRPLYPEYKEEAISMIKEKIKEEENSKENNLTYEEKMKRKYKNRPASSRCDRITVIDEATCIGEQIPFYNNYYDEKNEKKILFNPNKKVTSLWKKNPEWKFNKLKAKNEFLKIRNDLVKEKIDSLIDEKKWSKKDLLINVRKSFYDVNNHGKLLHTIYKKFYYKKEEHYKNAASQKNIKYVGPQEYWKVPLEKNLGKKNKNKSFIEDSHGNKIYYMDRKKTDKRNYTPNMRKSVY